jgi:hypothetical protein
MKRYTSYLIATAVSLCIYFCANAQTPIITSFTPAFGPSGTTVTINGSNFSNIKTSGGVKFGGINANSFTVVSTSKITAKVSTSGATGLITVTTNSGIVTTSPTSFTYCNVTVASPTIINGVKDVCSYFSSPTSSSSAPVTYYIDKVNKATSYVWVLPTGASLVSGGTDTSISVQFSRTFTSGYITVQAKNICGTNSSRCSLQVFKRVASTAAIIQKSFIPSQAAVTAVCGLTSEIYRIKKVAYATSYHWSLKIGANASITHLNPLGENDTAIQVNFGTGFVKDTISVISVNACSYSSPKKLPISTLYGPPSPLTLTCSQTNFAPCIGSTVTFSSSSNVPSASQSSVEKYVWTIPTHLSLISANSDSSTITVNINSGFVGANILVKTKSACNIYNATSKSSYIKYYPSSPTNITSGSGSFNICPGYRVSFSAVQGSASSTTVVPTAYRWTIPSTCSIVSSNTDSSKLVLNFNSNFTGGVISVKGVSSCGIVGTSSISKTITTNGCLSVPAAINGPQALCNYFINNSFTDTVYYSVNPIPGADHYDWILPRGVRKVTGDSSERIGVIVDSSLLSRYGQGIIYVATVSSINVTSAYTYLRLYIGKPLLLYNSINGPSNICEYLNKDSIITYTIDTVSGINYYNWSVPNGVSIISGQGTSTINLKATDLFVNNTKIAVRGESPCGISAIVVTKKLLRNAAQTPGLFKKTSSLTEDLLTNVANQVEQATSLPVYIRKVEHATSYNWSFLQGSNAIITHINPLGENDTAIVINFNRNYRSDVLTVSAQSNCNVSAKRKLTLTALKAPPLVNNISGNTDVCINSIHTYTATSNSPNPNQSNVHHYKWFIPTYSSVVSYAGADSSEITIRFKSNFSGGSISASTVSSFGASSSYLNRFKLAITLSTCRSFAARNNNDNQQQVLLEQKNASGNINNDFLNTNNTKEFEVYPNPSNSEFTLQLNDLNESLLKSTKIDIYDSEGRLVNSFNSISNKKFVFGNNLKPGIYLLIIQDKNRKRTFKIIKT